MFVGRLPARSVACSAKSAVTSRCQYLYHCSAAQVELRFVSLSVALVVCLVYAAAPQDKVMAPPTRHAGGRRGQRELRPDGSEDKGGETHPTHFTHSVRGPLCSWTM